MNKLVLITLIVALTQANEAFRVESANYVPLTTGATNFISFGCADVVDGTLSVSKGNGYHFSYGNLPNWARAVGSTIVSNVPAQGVTPTAIQVFYTDSHGKQGSSIVVLAADGTSTNTLVTLPAGAAGVGLTGGQPGAGQPGSGRPGAAGGLVQIPIASAPPATFYIPGRTSPAPGFNPSAPGTGFGPSGPNNGFGPGAPNSGFGPGAPNTGFGPGAPGSGSPASGFGPAGSGAPGSGSPASGFGPAGSGAPGSGFGAPGTGGAQGPSLVSVVLPRPTQTNLTPPTPSPSQSSLSSPLTTLREADINSFGSQLISTQQDLINRFAALNRANQALQDLEEKRRGVENNLRNFQDFFNRMEQLRQDAINSQAQNSRNISTF
jgi:hypothetical protein